MLDKYLQFKKLWLTFPLLRVIRNIFKWIFETTFQNLLLHLSHMFFLRSSIQTYGYIYPIFHIILVSWFRPVPTFFIIKIGLSMCVSVALCVVVSACVCVCVQDILRCEFRKDKDSWKETVVRLSKVQKSPAGYNTVIRKKLPLSHPLFFLIKGSFLWKGIKIRERTKDSTQHGSFYELTPILNILNFKP